MTGLQKRLRRGDCPLARRERKTKEQKTEAPKNTLTLPVIKPLTQNQALAFREFKDGQNLFLHGVAGTGKTFLAMYLGLRAVLSSETPQKKLVVVRSAVPTRDMGFLPGNTKEKAREFEAPYQEIASELFGRGDAWSILKTKGMVDFITTSYFRGLTIRESIVVLDEFQNFSYRESTGAMMRIGPDTRLIISGDRRQNDLSNSARDVWRLMNITERMPSMSHVDFGVEDIVRSGFAKEFLLALIEAEEENDDRD